MDSRRSFWILRVVVLALLFILVALPAAYANHQPYEAAGVSSAGGGEQRIVDPPQNGGGGDGGIDDIDVDINGPSQPTLVQQKHYLGNESAPSLWLSFTGSGAWTLFLTWLLVRR